MPFRKMALWACTLGLLSGALFAQSVTSNLVGTVVDPSGAPVPAIQVELTDTATGASRTATSGNEGIFRFTNLVPSAYSISIKTTGFKTYQQQDIRLNANETRDLGQLKLQLGQLTEAVNVTAEATVVQTASSEKGSLVDGTQLNRLALKGRDMIVLLNTMPGVYVNTGAFNADTTSEDGIRQVSINGAPTGKANFMVDGIMDLDSGSFQTTHYEPNMDAIAEVKVLTAGYQAEYGTLSGGSINVVVKSGTQKFHGTAVATKRHEMFNAKNYFDNMNNNQKPKYRYFIGAFSIGGPAYIPKVINKDKKKLFFMFSQEYTKQRSESGTNYYQVPTALERQGDFSQTFDSTGRMIPLFDPATRQPVPGNKFSPSLANPAGAAMLNFFPLPNRCGASGAGSDCWTESDMTQINRRNYRVDYAGTHPRRNDVLRFDSQPTSKLTLWYHYINDYDLQQTSFGVALKDSAGKWSPYSEDHPNPGHGHAIGATYTISPTLVNEANFGRSYNTWDWYPHDQAQLDRKNVGNPPHWFNEKDPLFTNDGNGKRPNLPPGAQNFAVWAPAINGLSVSYPNMGNRPYTNWNNEYSFSDSISWVKGSHNLKAGIHWQKVEKVQQAGSGTYLGNYNFGTSGSWPYDAGYGNANAFLGNFQNYSEGGRVMADYWYTGTEFFVQDNWKVSKRVSIDAGVRFYRLMPQENTEYTTGTWLRSAYDPKKAARLYQDGCKVAVSPTAQCSSANQIAVDPVTGANTFPALANSFVPGSGDYFNGFVIAGKDQRVPLSVFTVPGLAPAFRLGLAWDVFGTGKTAIRTSFGQFFNRGDGNQIMDASGKEPVTYTRQVYYSNMNDLAGQANTAAVSPPGPTFLQPGSQKYESSTTISFGLQQQVGFGTVIDASYVGAFRRHQMQTRYLNSIPLYSQFDPQYADPWSLYYTSTNFSKRPISDNNLRPLKGLGDINARTFDGSLNYNSFQLGIRRNMRHGLQYGLAYTFSKTMAMQGGTSRYFDDKFRNWGPQYSGAPHFLTFNYVYEVPKLGKRLNSRPLGWLVDNWTISGITTYTGRLMYGLPGCCNFSNTSTANPAPNYTGSNEGARMVVTGNPVVNGSDVKFNMSDWTQNNTFNWQAFALPMPCSWTPGATPQQGIGQNLSCFGNAGPGSLMSMPLRQNNWDMNFAKSFHLGKESNRILMFRAEMYNIWNHTQFNGINTTIQFDYPNWQKGILQQTNNQLGRYTGARDPRRMAMTLRLEF